jgi:hypothetical protein
MRTRNRSSRDGESHLAASEVRAIATQRTRVENELGHAICGRYLGTRGGRADVCWKTPRHAGTHL